MAVLQGTIPLWSKWNAERLQLKEQEVGSREFARGWRQRALSDDETLFKEEFVRQCISEDHVLHFPGPYRLKDKYPRSYKVFMGVDLAIAASKSKGDYFTITTIITDKDYFNKQIVGFYRARGLTFNAQIHKIESLADFYQPTRILVENNAYQEAVVQELQRTTDLPVEPFTTHAVNKFDLEEGLPRLSVDFEKGKWTIPYGDDLTRESMNILVNELLAYPVGAHDDTIMSLWFAHKAAMLSINSVEKRIYIV